MNSFMSWVGGKKALREEIVIRLNRKCDRYVEVFGGGGWILFYKPPGKFEVYNDFNPNLVNLYRCVREHPILTSAIPTRSNYAFLGWATDPSATSVSYLAGATYTAEESTTLYAVWQERNYDFSVSDLVVTPNEVEQYGKINVTFRLDSWDRNLPYEDIPVEVLLNGSVIYTTSVNFSAYGVQNIVFNLNVGASLGTQTLVARVNWADHDSETRTGNNTVSTTFEVKKKIETSASVVTVSGEYTEGTQVISSFYFNNECSSDILPDDNVSFDFLVYCLEDGKVKTVSQQTLRKVVAPANGRNLVYFKWTVPADSASVTFYCKGTIN